jgi:hypothetical protein
MNSGGLCQCDNFDAVRPVTQRASRYVPRICATGTTSANPHLRIARALATSTRVDRPVAATA